MIRLLTGAATLLAPYVAAPATITANDRVACGDVASAGPVLELRAPGSALSVVVAPDRGGEMIGLGIVEGTERRELLYRGMDLCADPGWAGKAPLLWPATGRNWLAPPDAKTGRSGTMGWRWQGRDYPIKIHGFARDQRWSVVGSGNDKAAAWLRLRLVDTAATWAAYPFGFTLDVEYRLRGAQVDLRYMVTAARRNPEPMPFSIGNHITFKAPFVAGGPGFWVTTPATRHLLLDPAGRPTGAAERIAGFDRQPVAWFGRETAYSLAGFRATPTTRFGNSSGLAVTLSHHGSMRPSGEPVLFNLWGNPEAGFFAPEPWWGRQDSLNSGDGLIRLEPGATFHWTLSIDVTERATR